MDYISGQESAAIAPPYTSGETSTLTPNMLNAAENNAFLSLMLSTIDIDELANNYFQFIAAKLPLKRLTFASEGTIFDFGYKQPTSSAYELPTTRHLIHKDCYASIIHYYCARPLNVKEKSVLIELHSQFCIPLMHALAYRQLQTMAMRDRLTGLGNRADFEEHLTRLSSQAHRHQVNFALVLIDLDNFKQLNDRYGHLEGDRALIVVAQRIRENIRDEDVAFRLGGDEFCCLLNAIDEVHARVVTQRICDAIDQDSLLKDRGITASIGYALSTTIDNKEQLFERADKALYVVKKESKNGVHAG